MKIIKWLIFVWILLIMACKSNAQTITIAKPNHDVFFDKSGMDTTVKPGDDFYQYANGNWLKRTKIPANQVIWGSFNTLQDETEQKAHNILIYAAAHTDTTGSTTQKVGDYYRSGMDTIAIEKLGFTPVKAQLQKIAAVKNYNELVNFAANGFKNGTGFLFDFEITTDDKNTNKYSLRFSQKRLGMISRNYYLKADSPILKIRNAYINYITTLLTLTGIDEAAAPKKAADILTLEIAIAQSQSSNVEMRDPEKNYNKFSVAGFQKLMPDIDLTDAFKRMALKTDSVLVGQPAYYEALDKLLLTTPIAIWKDKATFDLLNSAAPYLSKSFREASFDFNMKTIYGQKIQKPRWQQLEEETDAGLGDLLGKLYVQRYFPPESKKRAVELVKNLQDVFRERIQKLDWMSDSSKKRALEKLNAYNIKIGYPDKWKNYDDVTIIKTEYYQNHVAIAKHDYAEMINKLGKPVDRSAWDCSPLTVIGYNGSKFNDIVFPAAILQFPFFDKNADDAVNYGGIGVTIGHEMTHSFDDYGSQFDKNGNLRNWWAPNDVTQFKARVHVIVEQFNQYTVLNGLHVNGEYTQGENLANLGGLLIAYQAFKNTPEGKSKTKIDGFTPEQRFFLSAAQTDRAKYTEEALRMTIASNPHAPAQFWINGSLSNMAEFYKAFDIKPGDKLYRPENERVKVW